MDYRRLSVADPGLPSDRFQVNKVLKAAKLSPPPPSAADPGFSVGGRGPVRGPGPPMQALFAKNVCKNERIGSRRGACARHAP